MDAFQTFHKFFITYGGYKVILDGLWATVQIAVFGLLIGLIIGTCIAMVKVLPGRGRLTRFFQGVCSVYVGFFRGTPVVVQLLLFYYALPSMTGMAVPKVLCAIITFGLNSGAYVSEIMRSGILSVDKGQMEAGRSLGLGYWSTMLSIVLPQAVKNILPTLGNEFITLIKETSVVSFIAIIDLTKAFQDMANSSYEYIVTYLVLALVYLVLVYLISLAIRLTERRLRKSDNR